MPLAELRERVEQSSARVKWRVKRVALDHGQKLWFTPPHIGKYLSPIELLLSTVKWYYKRSSAEARVGLGCVRLLRDCMNRATEMTAYIRTPAGSTRAFLFALRDGPKLMHKNKPVLVPELHDAMVAFGRNLQSQTTASRPSFQSIRNGSQTCS